MSGVAGAAKADAPAPTVEAASTVEVQQVVREAAGSGAPLRIAGAGTWLHAGRPVTSGTTLSVLPLAGIVEYVPGDLTITAWAGTTLAELDQVTAQHGQWLALDPLGARTGTLGATVATGSCGPLAASFGTPRDVVLGVQCVTGDGDIVHGGARVVKHVAGFDLVRLVTGAWGTLGVLTMLTVRLRARAQVDATYAVTVGATEVREWVAQYRTASVSALAAELLSGTTAAALGVGHEPVALVRVSGNDEAVTAQERALRDLGEVRPVAHSVWATLAAADPPAPALALRLSHRAARIGQLWDAAVDLARDVPDSRLHATIDRGVARVVLPRIAEDDLLERLERPTGFPCARVFEVLPAPLWSRVAPCAVADALSTRIRAAFDPERRLNRGILGET